MTNDVDDPIMAELVGIVSGVLGVPVDEIPRGLSLRDGLGVDSVTVLEIVLSIESRFRTPIPDDRLGRFADLSIADAAAWITAELAGQSDGPDRGA